jgi:ATP phosphoribosyltransferase
MLRIALPNKGRLVTAVRDLFDDAGLPLTAAGERVLRATIGDRYQALFVRAQDVPEFVADGAADLGVTGWDLVQEAGRDVRSLLDLGFGKCRLVVATREESPAMSIAELPPGTRVATAFPRTAEAYFARAGRPVEIVPVSGAAEVAPHLGIADAIVDLVSTGSTLRLNGLRPIATILHSTAHLVGPGAPLDARRAECRDELRLALHSVLLARGQRYVMANVPRAALPRVREVLPGLTGPTVTDVMDGGAFVAVHAVVGAGVIDRTMAALKSLGAEGILVTRIERLMP